MDVFHWQTLQRLRPSVARWQPQRDSWSPWTAPSAITAPPALLPCSGPGREEPSRMALSPGRYSYSARSPTGWCYWPLCPSLCHTRWNPGSDVKSATQEPRHWPPQRNCMWHVSSDAMRIFVYLHSVPTLNCCSVPFFFWSSLVSPKDVVVIVQSMMVQEGSSALLDCSCKADPPASEYHWSYTQNGRTVHLRQRTHRIRVFNVTRDMTVRCSAENLIGRGESRPTLLNIHCNSVSCIYCFVWQMLYCWLG